MDTIEMGTRTPLVWGHSRFSWLWKAQGLVPGEAQEALMRAVGCHRVTARCHQALSRLCHAGSAMGWVTPELM